MPNDQTTESLDAEASVFRRIEQVFGARFYKLAPIQRLDGVLVDLESGHVNYYCELKIRNCLSTTYPTLMISSFKIQRAQEILNKYAADGVKVAFFVQYKDKLLAWEYNPLELGRLVMGGRSDRYGNGHSDIEPVHHIPLEFFVEVPGERTGEQG